jgi:hypothetical protein
VVRKDAVIYLPIFGAKLTNELPRRPLDTTFEKRCNTRNYSQRNSPKCPAYKGEHPIFDRKCKFHPKHVTEKPKFGPTLPLVMAKEKLAKERGAKKEAIDERREEQGQVDENMADD